MAYERSGRRRDDGVNDAIVERNESGDNFWKGAAGEGGGGGGGSATGKRLSVEGWWCILSHGFVSQMRTRVL